MPNALFDEKRRQEIRQGIRSGAPLALRRWKPKDVCVIDEESLKYIYGAICDVSKNVICGVSEKFRQEVQKEISGWKLLPDQARR